MNVEALRNPGFRRYFLANTIALHGLWLQRITLGWLAWSLSGQAAFVGFIAFLSFAPTLVSGPLFGVAADRVDLRRAAFLTQSILACWTAVLLVAHLFGLLGPVLLALIAGGIGITTSAHHPIRMSLAPHLAGRAALGSVVALTSLSFNLARLAGPALGGWLIATHGVSAALAVNLVCYAPFIVVIARLRLAERPRPPGPPPGVLSALGDGMRYAAGRAVIRDALLLTGVFSLIGRGLLEILPVIADGAFGRGPAGLGWLTAAAGGGALAASLSIAFGPGQVPGRLPRASLVAAVSGLAIVILLGATESWPLALAGVAGLGCTGTFVGVTLQTTVQLVLPDDYRGRVMSLWSMVAIGAAALGAIGLGSAADLAGLGATLMAAGAVGLAGVLAMIVLRVS